MGHRHPAEGKRSSWTMHSGSLKAWPAWFHQGASCTSENLGISLCLRCWAESGYFLFTETAITNCNCLWVFHVQAEALTSRFSLINSYFCQASWKRTLKTATLKVKNRTWITEHRFCCDPDKSGLPGCLAAHDDFDGLRLWGVPLWCQCDEE